MGVPSTRTLRVSASMLRLKFGTSHLDKQAILPLAASNHDLRRPLRAVLAI